MTLTQGSTTEDLYFFLGQELYYTKVPMPYEIDDEDGTGIKK